MRSIDVEVRNESGLHARPAADFVRAAAVFESAIRVENVTLARPAADAKSIIGVLATGAEAGHILRITADGADEERAVEALRGLVEGKP